MKLNFLKVRKDVKLPTRGTPTSAGLDLCADIEESMVYTAYSDTGVCDTIATTVDAECNPVLQIPAHCTVLVPTGLAVAPDREDVALLVYPRSGLATKSGINLANGVAVIDSDYRGEMMIPLRNNTNVAFNIKHGDRIAQLVVTPILFADVEEVEELNKTERGNGGFGSTGVS